MRRSPRTPRALRTALSMALTAGATLLLALVPSRAGAQANTTDGDTPGTPSEMRDGTLDQGTFIISQHGRPVRVEDFVIEQTRDKLRVRAASRVALPGRAEQPVDKVMSLVAGPLDYALGSYQSNLAVGPDTLRRGVEVAPGDTVFMLWRELNRVGTGESMVMPPGRMYILDPPLFTTFNFIGRTLKGKVCDRRPIKVFVLGPRDSLVDATVTDAGTETIRWGARPVQARKLVIADQATSFTAWFTPDGRMLRLVQARDSIRVDRKPPAVKRQPPRK